VGARKGIVAGARGTSPPSTRKRARDSVFVGPERETVIPYSFFLGPDRETRQMAPMPSQWLQRVPSPQSDSLLAGYVAVIPCWWVTGLVTCCDSVLAGHVCGKPLTWRRPPPGQTNTPRLTSSSSSLLLSSLELNDTKVYELLNTSPLRNRA